jgi:hypothetical protein
MRFQCAVLFSSMTFAAVVAHAASAVAHRPRR